YCFFVYVVIIYKRIEALKKQFESFFNQFDIDQVAITHFHEDQTGGAAYLQKERNIPLYVSDIKREYCMKKADYPLYRKFFWGNRKPFEAKQFEDYFQSSNDDRQ